MTRQDDQRRWVLAALDQYEGRLVRYAQRLVGDVETARDVVQDVFVKLCGQSPDEIDERLAAWLFAVCRNRSLDVLRSGGRSERVAAGREANGGCGSRSEPQQTREADPAEAVEQAELHRELRPLIDRLPDNQREALDLWAEGFRYAQIGEILGAKEGHVRVLVHRALKALREHPRIAALLGEEQPLNAESPSI
jgi:RNA polymerase sigma factor (sigma-70 family)